MGRVSSVAIATHCGLGGLGRGFPQPSRLALGPTPSYKMGTGCLPCVKRPGPSLNHSPTSCVEVKGVELCLYTPFGPSCTFLARNKMYGELYKLRCFSICIHHPSQTVCWVQLLCAVCDLKASLRPCSMKCACAIGRVKAMFMRLTRWTCTSHG